MEVTVKIMYDFDQIMKEMGGKKACDIMVLKAKDRFFVGYGCEANHAPGLPFDLRLNKDYLLKSYHNSLRNISICTDTVNME